MGFNILLRQYVFCAGYINRSIPYCYNMFFILIDIVSPMPVKLVFCTITNLIMLHNYLTMVI